MNIKEPLVAYFGYALMLPNNGYVPLDDDNITNYSLISFKDFEYCDENKNDELHIWTP